ncbi:MAG: HAMP domain-containing protein, partial [Acidobacteria bacterium]|nr:HAMP domain-containing protein [Acidobacteriota bacterium]
MKALSIRLRLSLLAAGLVVVTAFTLGFLGSRISRNEFRRVESVVAVAPGGRIDLERLRAPLLEEARRGKGLSGSASVLERLRAVSGAGGLVLLSPEGVTLAAVPKELLRSRILVTPDGALRVESGNDVALVRGSSLLLEPGDGIAPATLWAVPLPEPEEADGREGLFMRSVNRGLLLAALGVALAGAVATFLLVGRGVAPLVALTENARRLARGERAERLDSGRRDEIGRLAEAFDAMSTALERNERLRRDLISDVAHQLRTPLTNLRGQLEALQDGLRLPTRETIDVLHGEALALQRLVEDLQDLSLADAGELRLAR